MGVYVLEKLSSILLSPPPSLPLFFFSPKAAIQAVFHPTKQSKFFRRTSHRDIYSTFSLSLVPLSALQCEGSGHGSGDCHQTLCLAHRNHLLCTSWTRYRSHLVPLLSPQAPWMHYCMTFELTFVSTKSKVMCNIVCKKCKFKGHIILV